MADLTATTVAANYEKHNAFTSLGRTVIVKIEHTDMTDAELQASIAYLSASAGDATGTDTGGPDAWTVVALASDGGDTSTAPAFVSGESDEVTLALQGTGSASTANIKTALEALAGVTTVTILADFDQSTKGQA